MGFNLGNILAGLGGGGSGGGSGSGSGSNPTNVATSLLTGAASAIFPGLGSFLSNLLGGLRCLGKQAVNNSDYDAYYAAVSSVLNSVASDGVSNIMAVEGAINDMAWDAWQWENIHMPKLSNPCSKELQKKMIQIAKSAREAIISVYNVSAPFTTNYRGTTLTLVRLISRKSGVNINTTPNPTSTNPTTTVPTVVSPSTPTPVVNTPVVNTQTPVFSDPVVIKEPDGSSTTYLPNPTTGTTVVSTFNPKTSSTVASTVPTSSLNVGGYYDENGNWQITIGQNKQNYTPYIIGAAGLLGILLISKKRK